VRVGRTCTAKNQEYKRTIIRQLVDVRTVAVLQGTKKFQLLHSRRPLGSFFIKSSYKVDGGTEI